MHAQHTVCLGSLLLIVLIAATYTSGQESQALVYDDGAGHTMPYRLFTPPDPDASQEYPLVIRLHGLGECGTDNESQLGSSMENLIRVTQSEHPSFLVVPQLAPDDSQYNCRFWGQIPERNLVLGILEEVRTAHPEVDGRRIYLIGSSWGGLGTFSLLYHFPHTFTAAVSICGGEMEELQAERAPVICHVPMWVFHGALDSVVPVIFSRGMVQAMREAGGDPRYTEYPDKGHEISSMVYADEDDELYPWLFSQGLSVPFSRGDANADGALDISDALATLRALFRGEGDFPCLDAADSNDDGSVDISDSVYGLQFLFLGGPAPGEPFPLCGTDPTDDEVTCDAFPACQFE